MAIEAGSIKYDIEVDTKSLLQAEKVVTNSLNKQVAAIESLERELTSASQKISKTGVVTNAYGQVNKVATKKLSDLRDEVKRTGQEATAAANKIKKLGEESDASARAFIAQSNATKKLKEETAANSRAFQVQIGAAKRARARTIEFGEATGKTQKQIAAFSRASGQAGIQFQQFIGQVQGGQSPMLALSQQSADLGFVVGFPLLGAIAGISASIVGLLLPSLLNGETATGQLQAAMEALRETAVTTESGIVLLSAGIEKLAKKSAAAAAIEIELAMKQATAAIENARESIRDAADEWAGFGQGTALLDQQFFIAESAAKRLGKTIEEIVTGASVEQGGALAGLFGIEEAAGLRDAVASTAKEFKISNESALEYLRSLNEFKNRKITFEEFAETILKTSKENARSSESFKTLAQVTADATANAAEAADIQKVLALASQDLNKALKTSSESGFKAQEKAAKDLSDALDRMFEAEIRASDAQEAREKRQALSLAGTTIARGMSPIERLELEHEELNQLKLKFTEDDKLFQDALTANEAQQAEIRQAIALKERKGKQQAQQATQDFILGSVTAITSGIMASTDEQSAAFRAAFLIEKAVAIASILVNTELAAAKVLAHDAGILGLGAIATASIVRGIGFASAAFVGAQAISGARENGGPVSAGKSFLVGERGPEIFTPGAGGNVTSNKESFGGTTLNVLVENNTPSQVSTQLSDNGKQLKIIINEVARQISTNQGVIPKAMRQSTNTTFKTSR